MSKTYRTISGMQFVFKGGRYEAEPYSKSFEIDDFQAAAKFETDPLKAEMMRIKMQFEGLCKRVKEAQYFYYTVLEPAAIDTNILAGAKAMIKLCRQRLSIAWDMSVIWIEPEGLKEADYLKKYKVRDWEFITMDGEILGKTQNYSDKIWVLKGLPFKETMKVIAHELCHVVQSISQPIPDREKEAEGFADMVVQEYSRAV